MGQDNSGISAIWTEKFRPKTFEEVKGQKEIVSRVKAFVKTNNMPHLLFSGPAGVGKTTLSLVIVRQMFGENWRENFLELNASDERGIDVVRQKVKDFARTRSIGNVPFKIIYLDESDALTKEAQQALRRTMENYTQTTRFILSCNYSSKIIDPIQSRCTVFKFKPLSKDEIFEIVDTVAKAENLTIDDEGKEALFYVSGGDVRRLENLMQSSAAIQTNITQKLIYDVASFAEPKEIRDVLEYCVKGNFEDAKKKLLDTMLKQGLSGIDIIKQIQQEAWGIDSDNQIKLEMIKHCGEAEFRMIEGSDEFIQLEALLANFILLNSKN
ncbi:replication factor C small subunit [Candidatus Woesearchaeota archaeon]|nr:replication factor C small subunit [Candidatus Woesearchaeota archaeon]MCF7900897.1 replication factor C small subunit [Candidatus Woesearchaeota archaeon]MCF8013054.1 replication factor C small subunit [Candidatus Woesearchaeota archaeon]